MGSKPHQILFHENNLLYSRQFDDHYYSRDDGREECLHVFLGGNDLPERWTDRTRFTIGELGFGTGLNFLTTWNRWRETRQTGQHLAFISTEGFPLNRQTVQQALGQWPQLDKLCGIMLDQWHNLAMPAKMDEQTSLHVMQGLAEQAVPRFPLVDAWYLDGFAPSKNPDMWSSILMRRLKERTAPGGTCASYTAAGWVRRNLEDAGFAMEKRPGFGSKREMIAGALKGAGG